MTTWLLPESALTPGQREAVEWDAREHRLVLGLPGSGKTQVLVHRAARLARRHRLGPDRLRVFLYTNVLKDYIRSGLSTLGLPLESVSTFDAWCLDLHRRHVSRFTPRAGGGMDWGRVHREVAQAVRGQRPVLDVALVDEGQDLSGEAFDILKSTAAHVTVFADYLQQIFEEGAQLDAILRSLRIREAGVTLLGAHRSSPEVAALAARFIPEPSGRAEFLERTGPAPAERERPLYVVAPTAEAEMDRLAEAVRRRQVMGQRAGILVPRNHLVEEVCEALRRRGVEAERAQAVNRLAARNGARSADFASATPKVVSYHSAKGLTFDCVLLPRLSDQAFVRFHGEARHRLLFVGMARAVQWVYLSQTEGEPFRERAMLEAAAREKVLVLQGGAPPPTAPRPTAPPPPPPDDGCSFL